MLAAWIDTNGRQKSLRRKAQDPFWALRCSLCGGWNWCGNMVANLPQPCFVNAPPASPLLAIKIVLGWRYAPTQTLTTTFIRSRKIKSLIMTWHSIKEIPLHLFLDLLLHISAYFLILTKNCTKMAVCKITLYVDLFRIWKVHILILNISRFTSNLLKQFHPIKQVTCCNQENH